MPPPRLPRRVSDRDVISLVSHELTAPLASLRAGIDLLLDGALEKPRDARKIVGMLDRQSRRLEGYMRDLLAVSRLDHGRRAARDRVDLAAWVGAAIEDAKAFARERRVTVVSTMVPGTSVAVDSAQLALVLRNLLGNAIKYSRRGGLVTISGGLRANRAHVTVADGGIGIARDEMKSLFTRFHRTKSARLHATGMGLGLFIVKRVVEAHGCRVWARSAAGRGSTFSFTLPRAAA